MWIGFSWLWIGPLFFGFQAGSFKIQCCNVPNVVKIRSGTTEILRNGQLVSSDSQTYHPVVLVEFVWVPFVEE